MGQILLKLLTQSFIMKTKQINFYQLSVIITIAVFFVSCNVSSSHIYTINNKSDKELKVYYKAGSKESTVTIKPQTKVNLFTESGGGNSPADKFSFLEVFDSLKIEATDNSILTFDCLNISRWKSSTVSGTIILVEMSTTTYELSIYNTDF